MIHAIELENFKGVGARARLELAPVTLLFGANNAGKSTVLQSLLFVHEVLRRGSPEVDRTELGHDVLELGGFARMVHRHDKSRPLSVRVEFDTPGTLNRLGRDLGSYPFPDFDDDIDRAWVELKAGHRTAVRGALIEAVTIGVGEEPLVWIALGATLREAEPLLVQVNLGHPLLGDSGRDVAPAWEAFAVDVTGRGMGDGSGFGMGAGGLMNGDGFGDGRSVPIFAVGRTRLSALPPLDEPLRVIATDDVTATAEGVDTLDGIRTFLEMVILGIGGQLSDALGKALYVGPLRAVPPRGSLFERSGRLTQWGDGLAAWESLLSDRGNLVEATNSWLSKLGAGCKIVVQQLLDQAAAAEDVASEHVDASVRRLLLDSGTGSLVLPSELGAGISQVVPVVVASLLPVRGGLVMIEQPEIHVHPALQVELGDLVIEAASDRQLIIETHSEHLILRLLRRIRETHDGDLPPAAPSFEPDKLSVLYVERKAEGSSVRRLHIDPSGEFVERWPKGFFEERTEELF
jgi:hypothetical protein